MTDWLLDLGNTRLKVAAMRADGGIGDVHAFAHVELPQALGTLSQLAPGDRAWLASVAGATATDDLADVLASAGIAVERVRSRARAGRLVVAYGDPSRLGVDRFLALLAASTRDDGPWVLVSAGSALTADVLARDGRHLGGVIAPTAAHMRAMLGARFPALDHPAASPVPALGVDTAGAVAAGAWHAQVGVVERVLREARAQLQAAPTVLVSGGDADALAAALPGAVVAPALVLEGLACIARDAGG